MCNKGSSKMNKPDGYFKKCISIYSHIKAL